jgi:lipopolysaccharide/colanic/teichoic acid biosynthesis glycosyltransferase
MHKPLNHSDVSPSNAKVAAMPYNALRATFWKLPPIPALTLPDDLASINYYTHYSPLWKRLLDVCFSAAALLLLSPLLLLIAAVVTLESPGGALYSQLRTGKKGVPFRCYKFRSMRPHNTPMMQLDYVKESDQRITRIGALLRATSLDELPQLWNVLRGDMSLVGPRPQPVFHSMYYPPIIAGYNQRHAVRPGLTGIVQVSALRNEVDNIDCLKQRLACDLWYIQNQSFWLDMKIIVRTALKVLRLCK